MRGCETQADTVLTVRLICLPYGGSTANLVTFKQTLRRDRGESSVSVSHLGCCLRVCLLPVCMFVCRSFLPSSTSTSEPMGVRCCRALLFRRSAPGSPDGACACHRDTHSVSTRQAGRSVYTAFPGNPFRIKAAV